MASENSNTGSAGATPETDLAKPSAARTASTGAAVSVAPKATFTEAEGVMINANTFFKEYQEKMKPGVVVSAADGINMQTRLWRTLKGILKLTGPEFITSYRTVLEWVQQNRGGVMNEKYAYRFLAHATTLQAKDRVAFERLMAFMMNTCDPMTRRQVYSRYDTSYVYRAFDGTDVEAKLTEFYHL